MYHVAVTPISELFYNADVSSIKNQKMLPFIIFGLLWLLFNIQKNEQQYKIEHSNSNEIPKRENR